IDNIEPQSKKMSPTDRAAFQSAVAEQLTALKRSTFRGDVALKLDLATTSKTAPHAHTIAKNLLDLLGARQAGVRWPKRSLVCDEERERKTLGDDMYDAYRKMVRWSAQRASLGRSGVNIPVLTWMYGLPRGIPTGFDKTMWAQLVGGSKLLLQVGELPIAAG